VKPIQRLFIFDRKELFVLFSIVLAVSAFTFTLGVHLGKRVGNRIWVENHSTSHSVETVTDSIPNRQEIVEQSKGVHSSLETVLRNDLKEEVAKTGIKINVPRQTRLPASTKDPKGGATSLTSHASQFTLQIGSFPSQAEMKLKLHDLAKHDLKPFFREVEVKGKGKRYRLYVGNFSTKATAEKNGSLYLSQKKIHSFIVTSLPN
jgi:hypothetical protein